MSNVVTGGYMDDTVEAPSFPVWTRVTVAPQLWRLQVFIGGHTWDNEDRQWSSAFNSWDAE